MTASPVGDRVGKHCTISTAAFCQVERPARTSRGRSQSAADSVVHWRASFSCRTITRARRRMFSSAQTGFS